MGRGTRAQKAYPLGTVFVVFVAGHGAFLPKLGHILPPPVRLARLVGQLEDTQLPQVLLQMSREHSVLAKFDRFTS